MIPHNTITDNLYPIIIPGKLLQSQTYYKIVNITSHFAVYNHEIPLPSKKVSRNCNRLQTTKNAVVCKSFLLYIHSLEQKLRINAPYTLTHFPFDTTRVFQTAMAAATRILV